ncbi:MAG: nuclear transport factor 2 family protein [Promethearchaeota archaeon]
MNLRDPKLIVLEFNEYINNQDIEGITSQLTEDHIFIDRAGDEYGDMVNGWKEFFTNFPTYKNFFTRVESKDDLVVILGYAKWSEDSSEEDHAIWTAKIENDKITLWQIYTDTEDNRRRFNL